MDIGFLGNSSVHLWYQNLDLPVSEAETAQLVKLLSDDEQVLYHSYQFAPKRHEYLVARALVRKTLSRYARVSPNEWRFSANEFGRPEILFPQLPAPINFNISHTKGLVVFAISKNCEIGVDLEKVLEISDIMQIASAHFSEEEFNELAQQTGAPQLRLFYQYWTLKEAYIKGRGLGLSLPIQEFSFRFGEAGEIQISLPQHLDSAPEGWQFRLLRPTASHQLALALRSSRRISEIVEMSADLYRPQRTAV